MSDSILPESTTKRCSKCKQDLPVSAFAKCAQSKDGLYAYCKACGAAYRAANREAIAAHKAAYYTANREAIAAYHAAYYTAHREEDRARNAAYQKAHPEVVRAISRNRRARKLNAGGSHTAAQIKDLLHKQKGKCVYCKSNIRKGYHADHIVALAKGGSNDITNIQLTCPTCNRSKNAKDPIEFAKQKYFLL